MESIKMKVIAGVDTIEISMGKDMEDVSGVVLEKEVEASWGRLHCCQIAFFGMAIRRVKFYITRQASIQDQASKHLLVLRFQVCGDPEYMSKRNERKWLAPGTARVFKLRRKATEYLLPPGEYEQFDFFFDREFLSKEAGSYPFISTVSNIMKDTEAAYDVTRYLPLDWVRNHNDTLSRLFARADLGRHNFQSFAMRVVEGVIPEKGIDGRKDFWSTHERSGSLGR